MRLLEKDRDYIVNTYKRLPLEIIKAKGNYIYDAEGNAYFDTMMGISVNNLGHSPDSVVDAIENQLRAYGHLSNYFASYPSVELAELLVENSFADKVFYTNSGTEATEAALKLVKKWGNERGKKQILSALNSFHGRTTGALALTGQAKYQDAFRPLIPGVMHFKYDDLESLECAISDQTAAVFVELVQGEGGVRPLSKEFVKGLVELKKKYDFLIVIDEIQTGLGRAGSLMAYQNYDLKPDIVCLAKSLGGGLPLGAMLVREPYAEVLKPGDHGTTFGGNPIACAAGCAIVKNILADGFFEDLDSRSEYFIEKLEELKSMKPDKISDVRGMGMMIGLELTSDALEVRDRALKDEKLLINVTNGCVIRLLPNLRITREEIDAVVESLSRVI
ncbi:MAG: acetylornithine/succinylornithine family transaminase [Tissierellales bacterium]|nr:acetylornithine/succinylornithine family transaminase [Tissierellales bacterium]